MKVESIIGKLDCAGFLDNRCIKNLQFTNVFFPVDL